MSSGPERNVLGLFGAFVACSVVMGLLGAGLMLPVVGASGVGAKKSVDVFAKLPSNLEQPPLSQGSTVLDKKGKVLASFYEENREVVPLSKISPNMQNAVVAIEDARFYEHGGFDSKGLVRAFVTNKVNGATEQGASTLTQQYVKNVLVETAYVNNDKQGIEDARAQNYGRKLKEIRYAVALEKQLTKPEILERYLNIIWFGGKIYGVEAAAHFYYDTTAAKLTLQQAAMLAGMIQAPAQWDPVDHQDDAAQRRNIVLRRMLDLKMIDQATYETTREQSLGAKEHPVPNGCANAGYSAYFCDYVKRTIEQNDAFKALGATQDDRANALLRGGYTIKTTLDPKVQKAAWNSVSRTIKPSDKSKVRTAAVTVEPGTGNIIAMAQNTTYNGKGPGTGVFLNYSVDRKDGGSAGFQTGSTFKPYTLLAWLKAGHTLNDTVDASTGTRSFSSFKACGKPLVGGSYTYSNAGDSGSKGGGMSVWNATANSVNKAYVSMEQKLDICDIAKGAEALGVHQAIPTGDCQPKGETSEDIPTCYPSLTLGVINISPLTQATAYAAFAAEGEYCKARAVASIEDRDGNDVSVPGKSCKQAMDKDVADGMALGLSRVLTNGTAARVGPLPGGRPASGKTGTTNNSIATWFVGFTPQLATAVWVGRPNHDGEPTSLNGRTINGTYYGSVYGATLAAPIWKKIMEPALKGKKVEKFDQPPSSMIGHYTPPKQEGDDKKKTNDGPGNNGNGNGAGGIVDPNR
ncbi:transglycosylase domain-containing protein [Spongisporangium articulatum]|uniref:Transglycosylase domain-containing protein n=1 Tax=Spongisporangium articulatum TaxID=3362603 RepID=A0ABW8AIS0_9ACTN